MKTDVTLQPVALQDPPVEEQMLRALELFHYGNRYRDELFVVAVPRSSKLSDLALDLRLLNAAEVWTILVVESGAEIEREVAELSKRGLSLVYLPASTVGQRRALVQEELALGHVPVVSLTEHTDLPVHRSLFPEEQLWKTASHWGAKLQARKTFFLSSFRGVEVAGRLIYQLTPVEIERLLSSGEETNIGNNRLNFLLEQNLATGLSLTLVESIPGRLFLEVFTHRGKGTLVTKHLLDDIRRGRLGDVTELSLLMRPSILAGLLLPTTDDEIAEHIGNYFVYTVNDALVASSRLIDYGEGAELAKFCTLPRYQGKGRARDLTKKMIEEAQRLEKRFVFALSVSPKMWEFFLGLGFHEVPREELPETWKAGYDFARPSKAFRLDL